MLEELRDSKGLTILGATRILTQRGRVADWPKAVIVDDPSISREYRRMVGYKLKVCMVCAEYFPQDHLDACHIVPGAARSDEYCNLFMACNRFTDTDCHGRTEKNTSALPEILRAKCHYDKGHTDFVRIAELRRKHFEFDSLTKKVEVDLDAPPW